MWQPLGVSDGCLSTHARLPVWLRVVHGQAPHRILAGHEMFVVRTAAPGLRTDAGGGKTMIDRDTAQKVLDLKARGASSRAIARELRVARGTVMAICRGTWAGFRRPPREAAEEPERIEEHCERGRCVECGALLDVRPCRACRVLRRIQARKTGVET